MKSPCIRHNAQLITQVCYSITFTTGGVDLTIFHHNIKLYYTNLNYHVQCTRNFHRRHFYFKMIILSMHLLPRLNVMLDFICMEPVDLTGPTTKYKMTNSCQQWDSNTQPPDLYSDALPTELPRF